MPLALWRLLASFCHWGDEMPGRVQSPRLCVSDNCLVKNPPILPLGNPARGKTELYCSTLDGTLIMLLGFYSCPVVSPSQIKHKYPQPLLRQRNMVEGYSWVPDGPHSPQSQPRNGICILATENGGRPTVTNCLDNSLTSTILDPAEHMIWKSSRPAGNIV